MTDAPTPAAAAAAPPRELSTVAQRFLAISGYLAAQPRGSRAVLRRWAARRRAPAR